jgi:2-methylcitrate dehydratase PrpD
MGLTSDLGALLSEGDPHLTASGQQQTKLILLDTLGAMLAASRPALPGSQVLKRFIEAQGGAGASPVVGYEEWTDGVTAALVNGYLAYAMDIESHHGPSVVHAAAAVVPAVIAISPMTSTTGAQMIDAVALGVEMACRTSLAIGPNDLYARGFHPTAIGGCFGAAVAVARLLHLDAEATTRTLGLAATQAAGLLTWTQEPSEQSRPFTAGLAARNGFTAGLLAASGLGASVDTFDVNSRYNAFTAWSLNGTGNLETLEGDILGCRSIEELTIKRYACCAFLHPGIDALLTIMSDHGLTSADVHAIELRFPATGAPVIDGNILRSHRAQYILPLATVMGAVDFDDVIFDKGEVPEVERLARRTNVVHDAQLDITFPQHYASEVTVITRRGASWSESRRDARGTPALPLAPSEIVEKYHALAALRVPELRHQAIAEEVLSLDESADVRRLVSLLHFPRP